MACPRKCKVKYPEHMYQASKTIVGDFYYELLNNDHYNNSTFLLPIWKTLKETEQCVEKRFSILRQFGKKKSWIKLKWFPSSPPTTFAIRSNQFMTWLWTNHQQYYAKRDFIVAWKRTKEDSKLQICLQFDRHSDKNHQKTSLSPG